MPRYIGFGLILLLLLTSQSMAVARGVSGSGGQIELCTGTGPVMVFVDETGTPTDPPRYCPDQVLTVLAHVTMPVPEPLPVQGAGQAEAVSGSRSKSARPRPIRLPRGPPSAV